MSVNFATIAQMVKGAKDGQVFLPQMHIIISTQEKNGSLSTKLYHISYVTKNNEMKLFLIPNFL